MLPGDFNIIFSSDIQVYTHGFILYMDFLSPLLIELNKNFDEMSFLI
jgi:hypothetical protein